MKFTWFTKDGKMHEKIINNPDERLEFIDWLETSPDVVKWF